MKAVSPVKEQSELPLTADFSLSILLQMADMMAVSANIAPLKQAQDDRPVLRREKVIVAACLY